MRVIWWRIRRPANAAQPIEVMGDHFPLKTRGQEWPPLAQENPALLHRLLQWAEEEKSAPSASPKDPKES